VVEGSAVGTVTSEPAGIDCGVDCGEAYNAGSVVALTLTPGPDHRIDTVGGTCGGTLDGNTYTTAVVTADCTVEVSFAIDTHTVTPSAGPNGTIDPDTPQTVDHGSTVPFAITPAPGYHVAAAGGTCGGTLDGNTYTTAVVTAGCAVDFSFCLLETFFEDNDGDGFGNPAVAIQACEIPPGHAAINGDCNDNDESINPDAAEICGDSVDQDCDGDDTACPISGGDIDGNGSVELRDAILALQVVSGLASPDVVPAADVNDDGRIGLAEAIYILRSVGE